MTKFTPQCRAVLIGSLPLKDHFQAVELILEHTPDFPLWPQLPQNPKEGMVRQFLSGMPGLTEEGNRFWVDGQMDGFEVEMTAFYESYMASVEDDDALDGSRFALGMNTAAGFFAFEEIIGKLSSKPMGLKGQITGPVSTGIGVVDHEGRNIIFDDNLRDMMVKLLSLKAKWQVNRLKALRCQTPPMIFIDEPGIVSFGSSAYIAITREMVIEGLQEIIDTIHQAGGLAGIHICANGDFSLALESDADIISFDAYAYFKNVTLYAESLVKFIAKGGILAWGIVPTLDPDAVDAESTDSLFKKWKEQLVALKVMGISEEILLNQTLVASACGTGGLTLDQARKVLSMTRGVAERIWAKL
jgi:hypothetical protein